MQWDPTGRRLAVLLRAPHPAAGLVAVYSTTAAPVVHAELVGFARPLRAAEGGDCSGSAMAFAQRVGGGRGGAVLSVMGHVAGSSEEEEGADARVLRVANIALAV